MSADATSTGADQASGPFSGIRVVELAQWVFVPVAGALLADWGAEVLHIEPPTGDPYRGLATQGIGSDSGGVNLSMALANRGKRSVALDVRTDDGLGALHRLLDTADIFLTSLRPKALRKLGLDADTLVDRYPRLIFARGHGYGVRGPDADQAGYDSSAFWARGGMGHILTPKDREDPINQRGAMGDRNAAMALAFGMSAALLQRERTGKGSVVDVSLLATAMWTLSSDLLTALQGQTPPRPEGKGASPNPLVGSYRTKDGRHVQLVFLEGDRYWPALCEALQRPDLAADPRFCDLKNRYEHRVECATELENEFGSRTLDEAKQLLSTIDAPWAPMQAVEELLEDPQVIANGYIGEVDAKGLEPYRLPAVPVQINEQPPTLSRAPELGEDTEAVLLELEYDWTQIAEFSANGIIP